MNIVLNPMNNYSPINESNDVNLILKTGIRPHECPVCGKGFPSTTTLRKHSISHTSLEISRQYICDLCGKSFIQLSSLKMHKKTIRKKFYLDKNLF